MNVRPRWQAPPVHPSCRHRSSLRKKTGSARLKAEKSCNCPSQADSASHQSASSALVHQRSQRNKDSIGVRSGMVAWTLRCVRRLVMVLVPAKLCGNLVVRHANETPLRRGSPTRTQTPRGSRWAMIFASRPEDDVSADHERNKWREEIVAEPPSPASTNCNRLGRNRHHPHQRHCGSSHKLWPWSRV